MTHSATINIEKLLNVGIPTDDEIEIIVARVSEMLGGVKKKRRKVTRIKVKTVRKISRRMTAEEVYDEIL